MYLHSSLTWAFAVAFTIYFSFVISSPNLTFPNSKEKRSMSSTPTSPHLDDAIREHVRSRLHIFRHAFDEKVGIPDNATEEEAPIEDFFAFTFANVRAARVAEWYGEILKELNSTIDKTRYRGEWKEVALKVFKERNFLCGPRIAGRCEGLPDRRAILEMYAGRPRADARRAYFLAVIMQQLHEHDQQWQAKVTPRIIALVPYLIKTATFQQKLSDTKACKLIAAILKGIIAELFNILCPVVNDIVKPMQKSVGSMEDTVFKFDPEDLNDAGELMEINPFLLAVDAFMRITSQVVQSVVDIETQKSGGKTTIWAHAAGQFIRTGVSENIFCQGFSGNYPDLNLENEQGLVKVLTQLLDNLVTVSRVTFYEMYNGSDSGSITLAMIRARDWDRVQTDIDEAIDSRKEAFVERVLLFAMGETASQDRTFMPCNLVKEGETCQPKEAYEHPNAYRKSIFCPYPDQYDGRLQCSLGHYHRHVVADYVEASPLLGGLNTLRDNTQYNYTVQWLMEMALDNYHKNGNKPPKLGVSQWGNFVARFHLPVCMFPQGRPMDFTEDKYLFNTFCGNFTADQTVGFLERMNLGVGSPDRTDEFRTYTVPRGLYEKKTKEPRTLLAPVSWYAVLCRLGYHMGEHGARPHPQYLQEGPDSGCDDFLKEIDNGQHSWNLEAANHWFCGKDNPYLGDRKLRLKHIGDETFGHTVNLRKACDKWEEQYSAIKAIGLSSGKSSPDLWGPIDLPESMELYRQASEFKHKKDEEKLSGSRLERDKLSGNTTKMNSNSTSR
ncbi:hypothetical protein HYFRA_00012553 [Hymenoscyphus fraxineus]|uniref:Uncharacterized protein n=1 Tax=Hymenoscyphus fraxineus TaxID=746836 RepID=A0A9N9PTJ4_9HELO|nr:hypothetical protein HYFRA_00012553 [Hymenoscyphus fraxineus]